MSMANASPAAPNSSPNLGPASFGAADLGTPNLGTPHGSLRQRQHDSPPEGLHTGDDRPLDRKRPGLSQEKRPEYDSRKTLEKILEKALEDTNWSQMSEGVSYRLGFLSGRIRGYETEEDLQELTKSRMKKNGKLVKVSNSRSAKYASMFPDNIKL